jgi:23S rRNA pseudouridine2457 synthase
LGKSLQPGWRHGIGSSYKRPTSCQKGREREGRSVARKEEKRDCLSRVSGRQPLARVLAASGWDSRKSATGLLRQGRVTVNGRLVHDAQFRADPFRDDVRVDGREIPLDNACRYLLLNKPYNVLCAFTDPEGRPTLADFVDVPDVYAAGRLDLDSEGLLLLTGDGWLIHRMGHPRYRHPKVYLAQVEGVPNGEALAALRKGLVIKDRRTAPAQAELLSGEPDLPPRPVPIRYRKTVPTSWLRMVLTEGRKRQVRRMTAAVGHPTLRLVRVGIGPLEIGSLQPGQWRDLQTEELDALQTMLGTPRG